MPGLSQDIQNQIKGMITAVTTVRCITGQLIVVHPGVSILRQISKNHLPLKVFPKFPRTNFFPFCWFLFCFFYSILCLFPLFFFYNFSSPFFTFSCFDYSSVPIRRAGTKARFGLTVWKVENYFIQILKKY